METAEQSTPGPDFLPSVPLPPGSTPLKSLATTNVTQDRLLQKGHQLGRLLGHTRQRHSHKLEKSQPGCLPVGFGVKQP